MAKFNSVFLMLTLLFCFYNSGTVYAAPLTGLDGMQKVFNRNDGQDSYFKVEMILIDKKGYQRKRILEIYSKDYGRFIKTYLKFLRPADIEGTGFLSLENEGRDNTQYLYLPALGRVRRIVSSQNNLRFVNTDFSYEDMQRRRPDKDKHRILREEDYQGRKCFVVESVPLAGDSQYSKRIIWVDKASFVVVKIDFYDKKDTIIKELRVEKLEKKSDIWTAMKTVMEDFKSKHKTVMRVLDVKYNQGLDDEVFSLRHLQEN